MQSKVRKLPFPERILFLSTFTTNYTIECLFLKDELSRIFPFQGFMILLKEINSWKVATLRFGNAPITVKPKEGGMGDGQGGWATHRNLTVTYIPRVGL